MGDQDINISLVLPWRRSWFYGHLMKIVILLATLLLAATEEYNQYKVPSSPGLLCISECVTCPTICSPPPSSSSSPTPATHYSPPPPPPYHSHKPPPSPPPSSSSPSPPSPSSPSSSSSPTPPTPAYVTVPSSPSPPSQGSRNYSYPYYYFYASKATTDHSSVFAVYLSLSFLLVFFVSHGVAFLHC